MWSRGSRVQGFHERIQKLRFGVQGLGVGGWVYRVGDTGVGASGLGLRVQGLGVQAQG